MNNLTKIILLIVALGVIGFIVYHYHSASPAGSEPLANVSYVCNGGKTITATYYAGDNKPAATADQPPVPSGKVAVTLSDGRSMTLPQTLSADGGRYANADESFVFWTKGNGALVLENNEEKSYIGCIRVVPTPEGSDLTQAYVNNDVGVSMRIPDGYAAAAYQYQNMGPSKSINGVKFTIPTAVATGTNLASDTYLSIEAIPAATSCSANLFLENAKATEMSSGDTAYSVASTTGAGAGNRYEETVYAIPGTNPCLAIRYMIHYGVIDNYPTGSVKEFDKAALLSEFDAIRSTLVVRQ
jgi:membrane-bound inhibitor of C-type lysozyme